MKKYKPSEQMVEAIHYVDGHRDDCPSMYPRKQNNGATKQQEQELQYEINKYLLDLNYDVGIYELDYEQQENIDNDIQSIFNSILNNEKI